MNLAYSENQTELRIDDMSVTVRDVKEAVSELARTIRDYVDKKVLYEIAVADHDPDYSGYREKQELEQAEARLNQIIERAGQEDEIYRQLMVARLSPESP